MPLNTLRLNHAPSSHPNDRIVFIKPLPRPRARSADYETADTLLRAIAAQCLPIMKSHYLSVTTLEEHEPNPEFIGRNFNNGEVIQLVLRGKHGGWLPVNMIQMVMMHELAHNVHMNHGRKFWETRNMFAGEMRALWAKGYTGEGFWGGGRTLTQLGNVMGDGIVQSEELQDLPLCGGTFRSRGRKRKAKKDGLTWREQRDRRIEKKFGKNGVALGEDEDRRLSLELHGKGPIGSKPRVAQSKRGRELRAAAALARFDTNKKEVKDMDTLKREEAETQSEDEYEDEDAGQADARDVNGKPLIDSKGQNMIKVCEEEDQDDFNVKQEIQELEDLDLNSFASTKLDNSNTTIRTNKPPIGPPKSLYDIPQHQDDEPPPTPEPLDLTKNNSINNGARKPAAPRPPRPPPTTRSRQPQPNPTSRPCPICSLTNSNLNPTCTACSHVLDRKKDPRSWKCNSETCTESVSIYINAGDMGVCGICGARRADARR